MDEIELKDLHKFSMARKEYLKAKLRRDVLEMMILGNDFPVEFLRQPEKLRIIKEGVLMESFTTVQKLDTTSLQVLIEHIRKFLLSRISSLSSYWARNLEKQISDFSKVKTLPELVKSDLSLIHAPQAVVSHEKTSMLASTHFDVLDKICTKYCSGKIQEYNVLKVEHSFMKEKTMELKMKCIEKEVLCETYTPQAVKALEKIRSITLTLLQEAKSDIERTRATLGQYQAIGSDFESLVERFSKLSSSIKEKKWALEELQSR